MGKRRRWLDKQIGPFLREYSRKRRPGWGPNDRKYDRETEHVLRLMSPDELSDLMLGSDEAPRVESDDADPRR